MRAAQVALSLIGENIMGMASFRMAREQAEKDGKALEEKKAQAQEAKKPEVQFSNKKKAGK
jgi:hypothetical protein